MADENTGIPNGDAAASGQTEDANPFAMPSASTQAAAPAKSRGRPKLNLSRGSLLLVGLFAAGLVGVYMLSLKAGPSEAAAEQSQTQSRVDSALSALSSSAESRKLLARKDKAVIDTFYLESRHRQIPLSKLDVNPFEYAAPPLATPEPTADLTPPKPPKMLRDEAREREQAMAAARDLVLESILTGEQGAMAMISKNLLMEGQRINGWTVSDIATDEVLLTWKDQEYLLQLP